MRLKKAESPCRKWEPETEKLQEVGKMATKSFQKSINIHGEKKSKAFIRAIERSKNTKEKNVILSQPTSDMTREEIRRAFSQE